MKKYFLFVAALLFICLHSNAGKQSIEVNGIQCDFEKNNGMLDGNYVSYYPNGQLKCKGQFSKNNRVGVWQVFNTKGELSIERNYQNSLQFSQLLPTKYDYAWNLNEQFDMLAAEAIWVRKRFWKTMDRNDNVDFFKQPEFPQYLLDLYLQGHTKFYKDDRFVNEKTSKEKQGSDDLQIVSYKIKEEAMIDLRRFILDYRMVGICPVIQTATGTAELGWICFSDLRENILQQNNVALHQTLTTLISRQYNASDYKAITMSSLTHNDKEYALSESFRNDFQSILLLEKEHDVWLQFLLAKSDD